MNDKLPVVYGNGTKKDHTTFQKILLGERLMRLSSKTNSEILNIGNSNSLISLKDLVKKVNLAEKKKLKQN